ncbi:MAG: hypothetical protein JSV66_01805 [Trueperaceae bacterium]|nr:MAG: hypothetical protein JSV66_01805 [Trueperaceae bacterium]
MIGLHVAGALHLCETLPHEIDLDLVRSLSCSNPVARRSLEELVEALGSSPKDLELEAALEVCLMREAGSAL